MRDDSIGANTKVYKENTASADAWLFMQYRIKGYSFVLRYDAFNNSPLLDPQSAYTNHGIGFWQINKNIDKLDITMGSFYDQFGTGILFRAYEQRQIGIDYAITYPLVPLPFSKHILTRLTGGFFPAILPRWTCCREIRRAFVGIDSVAILACFSAFLNLMRVPMENRASIKTTWTTTH